MECKFEGTNCIYAIGSVALKAVVAINIPHSVGACVDIAT